MSGAKGGKKMKKKLTFIKFYSVDIAEPFVIQVNGHNNKNYKLILCLQGHSVL